jgi:uncharacterized membrane protein
MKAGLGWTGIKMNQPRFAPDFWVMKVELKKSLPSQKLWNITILKFGKSTILIVMFNSKLLNYQRATMGNIDGYTGISIHVIFVQTQVAGS